MKKKLMSSAAHSPHLSLGGRLFEISPEAIAAYEAGDFHALHRALDLRTWEISPLPIEVSALGVDPDDRPDDRDGSPWAASWRQAMELQRRLSEAVELHRQLIEAAEQSR